MPIEYLRRISGHERTPEANRHLGLSLAFIAGAANAGGFLAVGQYTSHMTGMVSATADHLALGDLALALGGMLAVLCFLAGAALSTLLIHWARDHHLRSQFALPLLLEALLLMLFGALGPLLWQHPQAWGSLTVLVLCFMMGLQNAIITKISRSEIRTTHVTGLVTDLGIGVGRLLYWRQHHVPEEAEHQTRDRLRLHAALVVMFFTGGILGALGFKHVGYLTVLPLAFLLMLLSLVPVLDDLRHHRRS
jgi:uncharacterized membrane protein YoaK (UPF0700 family)